MTIPFYSTAATAAADEPALATLLDRVIDTGIFSQGEQVLELEREVAGLTGARFAVGVNSATDGLTIGLMAQGVGRGHEVIAPVYSFVATWSSVVHCGATPVPVDIEADSYGMDPRGIARRVTERTRMIMPVHLFHQTAALAAIVTEAERFGVPVMEDSAEAIGMRVGGRHAGRFGPIGVLSYFPTKTLGAYGDAGMILTDDPDLAERCARLRDHGRLPSDGGYRVCGVNSRMDEIQAAVLRVRLRHLGRDIARRAQLAALYDKHLARMAPHVVTPRTVARDGQSDAVFYVYLIECERRDDLAEHLKAHGIGTEVYYPTPLHLQPCFRSLGYRRGDFPMAERAAARALALPLYPDLTEAQAGTVCRAIEDFYTRSRRR